MPSRPERPIPPRCPRRGRALSGGWGGNAPSDTGELTATRLHAEIGGRPQDHNPAPAAEGLACCTDHIGLIGPIPPIRAGVGARPDLLATAFVGGQGGADPARCLSPGAASVRQYLRQCC
jgi:hypothetical protein